MSKKFTPHIVINVNYLCSMKDKKSGSSLNFHDVLTEKAERFNGVIGGSGYSFASGLRDVSFLFNSIESAGRFLKAVRRFSAVKEIFKQAVLEPND